MSHVAKLSIAVLLAPLAAGLNAMWLSAAKRPPTFAALSVDPPEGQQISDDAQTSVRFPAIRISSASRWFPMPAGRFSSA